MCVFFCIIPVMVLFMHSPSSLLHSFLSTQEVDKRGYLNFHLRKVAVTHKETEKRQKYSPKKSQHGASDSTGLSYIVKS